LHDSVIRRWAIAQRRNDRARKAGLPVHWQGGRSGPFGIAIHAIDRRSQALPFGPVEPKP
jgi:hypothetical protein